MAKRYNYGKNKRLGDLYRTDSSNESFTDFKKKLRRLKREGLL